MRTAFAAPAVTALAALAALAASLAAPAAAHAEVRGLDLARRIPRSWSASRDTPALNLLVLPRDVRTAGGELAIATITRPSSTWRLGFAGLIELESDGETTGFGNVFPAASGNLLWRGSYAYYAAVSLDDAGARLCAGCAIELALQYRHESQHYTGSNHGDPGMDVTAEPFVGDDLIADAALSHTAGDWLFVERAVAMWFLPDRSSFAGGPAIDLHVRWRGSRSIQPFASGYAEYLIGDDLGGRRYPSTYLARVLAGVALPSALGDTLIYVAADVGNRKGIRGLTEEATLGVGIRLALGAARGSPRRPSNTSAD
jgi:hypothetical protein